MSEPRTWPPQRDRGDRSGRPDWRAARNTARHLAEGWAIEAAEQRKHAAAYAAHVVDLRTQLRALQRAAGLPEHDCPICAGAAAPATPAAAPDTDDASR